MEDIKTILDSIRQHTTAEANAYASNRTIGRGRVKIGKARRLRATTTRTNSTLAQRHGGQLGTTEPISSTQTIGARKARGGDDGVWGHPELREQERSNDM